MRRLAPVLIAASLLAGCPRKDAATDGTDRPDQSPSDAVGPSAAAVCRQTCARLDPCLAPLSTQLEVESALLLGAFPFDCARCESLDRPATPAQASALDCLPLSDCTAYYTCAAGIDPESAVHAQGGGGCEALCARQALCGGGADAEAACLMACGSTDDGDPMHEGLLGCATSRGCEGLVACIEHWGDANSGAGADPEHRAQPGVSATCQGLCDRTITCGAEELELDDAQLEELHVSLTGLFVECAVQCEAELERGGSARIDACLEAPSCETFVECAEKL